MSDSPVVKKRKRSTSKIAKNESTGDAEQQVIQAISVLSNVGSINTNSNNPQRARLMSEICTLSAQTLERVGKLFAEVAKIDANSTSGSSEAGSKKRRTAEHGHWTLEELDEFEKYRAEKKNAEEIADLIPTKTRALVRKQFAVYDIAEGKSTVTRKRAASPAPAPAQPQIPEKKGKGNEKEKEKQPNKPSTPKKDKTPASSASNKGKEKEKEKEKEKQQPNKPSAPAPAPSTPKKKKHNKN